MFPLKRGRGVAHCFNCTPAFVDMHLAHTLVNFLVLIWSRMSVYNRFHFHQHNTYPAFYKYFDLTGGATALFRLYSHGLRDNAGALAPV